MQNRFIQLLLGEALAFASFVFGGLAVLGGTVTANGNSQHPPLVSWMLVAAFALASVFFARHGWRRLKRVFVRGTSTIAPGGLTPSQSA